MKPIHKQETITIYEAYDGTTFSTMDECRRYENNSRFNVERKLKKYVMDGIITAPLSIDEMPESSYYTWYLLRSKEDVKDFKHIFCEVFSEDLVDDIDETSDIVCLEYSDNNMDVWVHPFSKSVDQVVNFFIEFGIEVKFTHPVEYTHEYTEISQTITARVVLKKLYYKAYLMYRQDWCIQRGKTPYEVSKENNPREIYETYEEFCNNEALNSEKMQQYLTENDYKTYMYHKDNIK